MIKKCHVTLKTSQKLTIEEFYLVLYSEELEYAFNLPNIVYICEHCPNGKYENSSVSDMSLLVLDQF